MSHPLTPSPNAEIPSVHHEAGVHWDLVKQARTGGCFGLASHWGTLHSGGQAPLMFPVLFRFEFTGPFVSPSGRRRGYASFGHLKGRSTYLTSSSVLTIGQADTYGRSADCEQAGFYPSR